MGTLIRIKIIIASIIFVQSFQVEARPINFASFPDPVMAIFQVAHHKGIWAKKGLKVELKSYRNVIEYIHSIRSSRADFYSAWLLSAAAVHKIAPDFVWIGPIFTYKNPVILYGTKEMTLKDLKNTPIGVWSLKVGVGAILEKALRKYQLSAKDLRLVEMSEADLESNFRSGRLKVIIHPRMRPGFLSKSNGKILLKIEEPIPYGFSTRRSTLKQFSNTEINLLVEGLFEAVKWSKQKGNFNELMALLKVIYGDSSPPGREIMIDRLDRINRTPRELIKFIENEIEPFFNNLAQSALDAGTISKQDLLSMTFENVVRTKESMHLLKKKTETPQ